MKAVQYLESIITEPIDVKRLDSIQEFDTSSIQQFSTNYNSQFSDLELKNFLSHEFSQAGSALNQFNPLSIPSNYEDKGFLKDTLFSQHTPSNVDHKKMLQKKVPRVNLISEHAVKKETPFVPALRHIRTVNSGHIPNQKFEDLMSPILSAFSSPKSKPFQPEEKKTFSGVLSKRRSEIGSKKKEVGKFQQMADKEIQKLQQPKPTFSAVKHIISARKDKLLEQDQNKLESMKRRTALDTSPESCSNPIHAGQGNPEIKDFTVRKQESLEKSDAKSHKSILCRIRGILSSGDLAAIPSLPHGDKGENGLSKRDMSQELFRMVPPGGNETRNEVPFQKSLGNSVSEGIENPRMIALGNFRRSLNSSGVGLKKVRGDSPRKLLENRDSSRSIRRRPPNKPEGQGEEGSGKKSGIGGFGEDEGSQAGRQVQICLMSVNEYSAHGMTTSIGTKNGQERRDYSELRRHLEEASISVAQDDTASRKSATKPGQNSGYRNLLSLGNYRLVNRY
jgi:hypothetical protein